MGLVAVAPPGRPIRLATAESAALVEGRLGQINDVPQRVGCRTHRTGGIAGQCLSNRPQPRNCPDVAAS